MGKATASLSNFNAGEFSPQMSGRVDFDKYGVGCHKLENFISLVQGPAMRRAGTRYVSEVKSSSSRTWLRRFEFSATQAFQIEFGDKYLRFYTNHGQLLVSGVTAYNGATAYNVGDLCSNGGVNYYCIATTTGNAPPNATYWYALTGAIYEIPAPWAVADLTNAEGAFALRLEQSGDVLYIAGGETGYAPYTLTRYGNTNWQLAPYFPTDGPFLELNSTATTLYASASTGSVTITASAALFAATDVGRLIRLDLSNFNVAPWETNKAYAVNDLVRNNGMTYKALNSATSGTAVPTHLYGSAYDGKTGVNWQYQDSGYGVARITAYTSSTQVTATVVVNQANGLNQFPSGVVGSGNTTTRWYLGAWSSSTEWPRCVAFFKDRLFWTGKLRWWGSVPGLYTSYTRDFNGLVTTDASVYGILSAQDVNSISWMSAANLLLIGTQGGEFGLGQITNVSPLGPENVQVQPQSKQRCRSVSPQRIGTSVMYVQRAARKVLAMDYNFYIDRYDSTNQTRLAYHITQSGVVDMAYQPEPFQVLWCVRADGQLLGYTFDREDNVTGWHRHILGGSYNGGPAVVESVSMSPAPDGTRDEIWLIVKRTVNGATKRFVEFMEKHYEPGDTQSSCFYVDSGATYSGAPATTISGLSYLEGQAVAILADGGVQSPQTVTGGTITLQQAASVVNVGLPYTSQLVSMRIEAGSTNGVAQGKTKRVMSAAVRLVDTLGGQVGMYDVGLLDTLVLTDPTNLMDNAPPIITDDRILPISDDVQTDCRVWVVQSDPAPMTVAAVFPNLETNEPW